MEFRSAFQDPVEELPWRTESPDACEDPHDPVEAGRMASIPAARKVQRRFSADEPIFPTGPHPSAPLITTHKPLWHPSAPLRRKRESLLGETARRHSLGTLPTSKQMPPTPEVQRRHSAEEPAAIHVPLGLLHDDTNCPNTVQGDGVVALVINNDPSEAQESVAPKMIILLQEAGAEV